jgi:predicted anti-sigma-YlaC factor YlaD
MAHPDRNMLRQLADGSLDTTEARRIEEHLASCTQCRVIVTFERNLIRALRETPLPEPSPHFDPAVLRAVSRGNGPAAASRLTWGKYAAAGLLIAATLIVVTLAGASGEEQSRSMLTPVFEQITALIGPLANTFASRADSLIPTIGTQENDVLRIFLLAMGVLLLLGGLERLLLPHLKELDHRS